MKNRTLKCAALCLLATAATPKAAAQQGIAESRLNNGKGFAASEWYLGLSLGDHWLLNGGQVTGTLKLSGGTWFNKTWGLRMKTQIGNQYRDRGINTKCWQTSLNATLNALTLFGNYTPYTRFSFDLSAGAGYNMLRYRKGKSPNTHTVSLNVGAQAGYEFTPRWGAFVDLSGYLLPKYFEGDSSLPFVIAGDWNIGLRYKFSAHRYRNENTDNQEKRIRELNARVDELNRQLNELIEKTQNHTKIEENSQVMLAPINEQASIDIYFDDFSAYLSDEQKNKMKTIGDWMNNNKDFSICVAVFADKAKDSEISTRIRKERMEVIRKVIIEKYGIEPKRIRVVEAEKLGYKNLPGCNAKIIFNK